MFSGRTSQSMSHVPSSSGAAVATAAGDSQEHDLNILWNYGSYTG